MTYRELTEQLARAGVDAPATDARLLISHFCGVCAAQILASPERDYTSPALLDALAQRIRRVPLQHITGEEYFYGERFLVSPDCLIPRADTELLVEEAIRRLPSGARFADLCTGSGCIALAVLGARPDTHAYAVDVSPAALAMAKQNAEALGLSDRITFYETDLLKEALPFPRPDVILSNPPYIESGVIPTLAPELGHEPMLALDGGEDGLLFYRRMLDTLSPALFLFEIGFNQGNAVSALGRAHGYNATVKQDLGGRDRLVILSR